MKYTIVYTEPVGNYGGHIVKYAHEEADSITCIIHEDDRFCNGAAVLVFEGWCVISPDWMKGK